MVTQSCIFPTNVCMCICWPSDIKIIQILSISRLSLLTAYEFAIDNILSCSFHCLSLSAPIRNVFIWAFLARFDVFAVKFWVVFEFDGFEVPVDFPWLWDSWSRLVQVSFSYHGFGEAVAALCKSWPLFGKQYLVAAWALGCHLAVRPRCGVYDLYTSVDWLLPIGDYLVGLFWNQLGVRTFDSGRDGSQRGGKQHHSHAESYDSCLEPADEDAHGKPRQLRMPRFEALNLWLQDAVGVCLVNTSAVRFLAGRVL